MTIKKFLAKTPRLALNQVKEELGEDATIISNRSINGWTEILARGEFPTNVSSASAPAETLTQAQLEKQIQAKKAQDTLAILNTKPAKKVPIAVAEAPIVTENKLDTIPSPQIQTVLKEIREMRSQFQLQIDNLSNVSLEYSPNKRELMSQFLSAGFNLDLAKRVISKLPSDFSASEAKPWAVNLLAKNLQVQENESEVMGRPGIYALLGPTGVGKTTTIAKIASRYVLKHGNQGIALVSTDTYRIGGHEQLRIYGKILGIEVYAAKDAQELQQTLDQLKDKQLVLIDMAGLSQKDVMVGAQLDMLHQANPAIQKIICLNASNTLETLNNVSKSFAGRGLEGCIITKVDEAIGLGGVINVVLQNKLKVLYLTNGQRVPEDIALVDKITLIEEAFNQGLEQDATSTVTANDLPAFFGNLDGAKNGGMAHHA